VAGRVLETLGLPQGRIDALQESWRDIPDAWLLRANYDKGMGKFFLVEKRLTIRQYEQLQRVADRNKQSVHELVHALHAKNIFAFIKPRGDFESYDAIFAMKRQGELQPKIQAAFDAEITQLLALREAK
jgi:hypothetical protein